MDLSEFLRTSLDATHDADRCDALRRRRAELAAELAAVDASLKDHDDALRALDGLKRCTIAGFMSSCRNAWLFVARYSSTPGVRTRNPTLTGIECVIVPDAVVGQTLHRPVPHEDPAQAARGVATMTPMPVDGHVIARETAARYGANVRMGDYADILVEPCGTCGANAPVVCNHGWDYDSGCQWVTVYRLCLRCPSVAVVADAMCDSEDACPLLPPSQPPARR